MSLIDERLSQLGIVLPDVMPPVVAGYVPAFSPFVRTGDQVHLSGRLGKSNGEPLCGKLGAEITPEQGKLAAREVAIELLGVLKSAVGDLDRVRKVVKLFVMVNSTPQFTDPHRVADGASELLVQVFGERGRHARSAIGVAQVPFGACVEIDMIVSVDEASVDAHPVAAKLP
jgi:enamine deaminase RidA (YjgF/YER057c/UK114 family)